MHTTYKLTTYLLTFTYLLTLTYLLHPTPPPRRLSSLTALSLYSLGIPQSAAPQLRASLPRLLSLGLDESPQQSK